MARSLDSGNLTVLERARQLVNGTSTDDHAHPTEALEASRPLPPRPPVLHHRKGSEDRMLTTSEVAKLLGTTVQSIEQNRWTANHKNARLICPKSRRHVSTRRRRP